MATEKVFTWQGYSYRILRSRRKTASLQIKDGNLIARIPWHMSNVEVIDMLKRHETWIRTHMQKARERQKEAEIGKFTEEELQLLGQKAALVFPGMVRDYAAKLKVTYGRITIRSQKTRWGSCSGRGNLNFNCLLMLTPKEVQEYVVVHELCHRKEMNHSTAFWKEVETLLPDYRSRKEWLKENGGKLIARLP